MAPTLGFSALILTFAIAIFLPIFSFFSYKRIEILELEKITKHLSLAIFCSAILTQFCLIYSFVISDYSTANVYQNSHHLKPLIYKISGSWGNHEGSMLLLISIVSAYSAAFAFLSKISSKSKIIILSSQSFIIACFAIFTATTSNPFLRIFPIPQSGLGLNPILQDIGLAMHPPMLYSGYIGFSLIFSCAIAALLREKIDKEFALHLKNWLFLSYALLTAGIGLGAWWAYRELGWGGYWFWDPVENISLMPWIGATILIHALLLLEKKDNFKIWSVFLAILTFILCLLGLFLVRSGILTSVHSFAIDAKRGFFVIALIALIGGLGLLIFGAKINKIKNSAQKINLKSKSGLIVINNYILLIALFVVLLGTIYPIFSRALFDEFLVIGAPYYNQIFGFLILPFLIFLAFTGNFNKQKSPIKAFIIVASIALSALTFFYENNNNILAIIILFLAIFCALNNLFFEKNLTAKLAHFGFSIIILGVVLSSYFGLSKELNIKEKENFIFGKYEISFVEIEHFAGKNFIARQGDFVISQNKKNLFTLEPQLRYYPINDQTTNETSIKHDLLGDLYLVIGTKDENENYALRAYYKPFIWLIWLGCFLIFFATISNIFLKKNEKKSA